MSREVKVGELEEGELELKKGELGGEDARRSIFGSNKLIVVIRKYCGDVSYRCRT